MLEIIGAGFGRTGTLSLKTALERLGFGPCHHMLNLIGDEEQIAHWKKAARGEPMEWPEVYEGYRSSVDWPGARFWRELAAQYPEAKIILTVRDAESWYTSAKESIYAAATTPPSVSGLDPVIETMRQMSLEVVWDGVFSGRFADKEYALNVYEEHNQAVLREIDKDRLLVFEVAQGWQPLCDFLGVPAPDEPFPRSNDRAEFTARVQSHRNSVQDA